ncbi:PriCT-2 domain-containing protein, partial [Pseudomonadota bacterium]
MTEIKEALTYISPDICRDEWAQVAMALRSELGDDGYAVFDTWSQGSDKYKESDCKSTWRSITSDGGVGIGTLFMMAKEGGYKPVKNGAHKPFKAPSIAPKPTPIDEPKDLTKSCEIAQKYWDESVPGKAHPYADKKGFPDHGLRVHGDQLCVPAYNRDKQIQSIQRISHDGKKKNLGSTKMKGCFHLIHGDPSTIVISEGWATAKSVNAATKYVSVVSFGCAGLK